MLKALLAPVTFSRLALIAGLCAVSGLAVAPASFAIPEFDGGFHQTSVGDGIMKDYLADGVPAEVNLMGFRERDLLELYENRNFQPSFWAGFGWDTTLPQALEVLANANNHGLSPAEYQSAGMSVAPSLTEGVAQVAAFDAQMTILMARYAHDVFIGRYNPDPKENGLEVIARGLPAIGEDSQFGDWLAELGPNTPMYQRMIELQHSLETAESAELPFIEDGPLLRQGIEHPQVPLLREYFQAAGYFDGEMSADELQNPLFDETVHNAAIAFQSRNGLAVDGVIGNRTREIMNSGNDDLLPIVKLNIERLRWEDPLETQRYIRVNIASYRLQAYNDGDKELDMRVVVGRRSRPTPILSDRITNLKFAPDWTVPRSILEADYLSSIRANASYVDSAGFQVKQGNSFVSPYSIDWSNPRVSSQVTLYRPSSSYGPLGGVRFSLTNDQAIYLHDTPKKYLFEQAERDRSSGCVRVGEPEALANFILEETSWSPSQINTAMNGNDTQYARPNDEVQVYLSYMTVWVDDEGDVQRGRDPYDLDEDLLRYFVDEG